MKSQLLEAMALDTFAKSSGASDTKAPPSAGNKNQTKANQLEVVPV